jgi:hypothetical protein
MLDYFVGKARPAANPANIELLLGDIQRRLIRVESRLVTLAAAQGVNVATEYGVKAPSAVVVKKKAGALT